MKVPPANERIIDPTTSGALLSPMPIASPEDWNRESAITDSMIDFFDLVLFYLRDTP